MFENKNLHSLSDSELNQVSGGQNGEPSLTPEIEKTEIYISTITVTCPHCGHSFQSCVVAGADCLKSCPNCKEIVVIKG